MAQYNLRTGYCRRRAQICGDFQALAQPLGLHLAWERDAWATGALPVFMNAVGLINGLTVGIGLAAPGEAGELATRATEFVRRSRSVEGWRQILVLAHPQQAVKQRPMPGLLALDLGQVEARLAEALASGVPCLIALDGAPCAICGR